MIIHKLLNIVYNLQHIERENIKRIDIKYVYTAMSEIII